MKEFTNNVWRRCGSTPGGYDYLPQDGTEFLINHPNWLCPAVVCKDSASGNIIFVDPDLGAENDIDYIVDFTDMWFYVYDDLPEEFYERTKK